MLVFIRHGKTQWNLEERLQGKEADSDLLPIDENFINNLNGEFNDIIFDKLIISPLKRALEFSKYINFKTRKRVINGDIAEISFGDFSGKRLDEIDSSIIEQRNLDKWHFRPKNGESYEDLYNRLNNIALELMKDMNRTNIAIIGHETCNKVLIGKIMGYTEEQILKLKQKNNEVYKIENNKLYKKIFNITDWTGV